MIAWALLLVSVVLAIAWTPWWFVATLVLALWKLQRWHSYKSRPWRRVHYPLMRVHAAAAGFEAGKARQQVGEFDLRRVLSEMVRSVHSNWNDDQISDFIDREYVRCHSREDLALIEEHLRRNNPRGDSSALKEALNGIASSFDPTNKGLMTRMIVAGIVEERYGGSARGEYLFEVFNGRAN